MKNKKFKLTFLGAALCFALVGCSNDDSVDGTNNNNSESGVVSNGEITLTYGSDLLKHNVQNLNERLNIQGMNGASARSGNSIPSYSVPNLSGAIILNNSADININNAGTYHIPNGVTITKNINLNAAGAILVIDGELATTNVNVNNGITVFVTKVGNISGGFSLNSGATLENWGVVKYTGHVQGTIKNYNTINFHNSNVNSNSSVENYCTMIFNGDSHLNKEIKNNNYLEFKGNLTVNSAGMIELNSGAFLRINSDFTNNQVGSISVPTGTAEVDIINATLASLNQNPFSGNISLYAPSATFSNTTWTGVTKRTTASNTTAQDCTVSLSNPASDCDITALNQTATYIGNILNPVMQNGVTLSATDVKVVGTKAYVSYHTNDEEFGGFPYGAIRVFSNDGTNVNLTSNAEFINAEFNALEINDDKVFAVGNNLDGGRMFVAPLNATTGITTNLSAVWSTKLPSLGGKSISFDSSKTLWLVGGANGGLYKSDLVGGNYNLTASTTPVVAQTGGKYVTIKNNNQVFFALKNGNPYLRIVKADGQIVENTDTTITLTNRDGKNALSVDDNYIYVALSEQGVAKYSLTDGSLVARFVPSTVRNASGSRVFPKNGLSNAVAIGSCFVYVANGADGVIILDKNTFKHVGYFKTGLNHSTNYVYIEPNGVYLYVANGRDGLRVIKLK